MPANKTDEEQKAYCDTWKQSGLSKIKFCKQNNISESALYTWLKKFNNSAITADKNSVQSTPIKFLQINNIEPNSGVSHRECVLEITMPSGVSIRANTSQNNLSIFLQELLKWK